MTSLISNPWFIGIAGGVLSGGIVSSISRYLFSKKERREYYLNITLANNEVISTLRHSISEDYIPNIQVFNSLINANSRKYNVNSNDMFNVTQICEEIIKEVMDTSFISHLKKEELFSQLKNVMNEVKAEKNVIELKEVREEKEKIYNEVSKYKSNIEDSFSNILGFVVAGASLLTTLVIQKVPNLLLPETGFENEFLKPLVEVSKTITSFVIIFLIMMFTIIVVFAINKFSRINRREESKNNTVNSTYSHRAE